MHSVAQMPPTAKPKAWNAQFQGAYGVLLVTSPTAAWFVSDAGHKTLLHDVDVPAVQCFGRKDLADAQLMADALHGDLYSFVMVRNEEKPRPRTAARAVTRLAWYNGDMGKAELVVGSGYLFRKNGSTEAVLVTMTDPNLILLTHLEQAA